MSHNDKQLTILTPDKKPVGLEADYKTAFEYAENILQTVRKSLIVLDANLRVVSANDAFYKTFMTAVEETFGRHICELGNRQWEIPQLKNLLAKIFLEGTAIEDFLVEHVFPSIGHKVMLLNARKVHKKDGNAPDLILLTIEDVTGRMQ